MSKIVNRNIKCAVCNRESAQRIIMSMYIHNSYLDGYAEGNSKYDRLIECPYCHYVSANIEKISDDIVEIIKSEKYKKLTNEKDSVLRKLKLNEYIKQNKEEFAPKAYANLLLYWYCEENSIENKNYLEKYFDYAEEGLMKDELRNLDAYFSRIIQFIDLLRQDEKYEDAQVCLEKLKQAIKNTGYDNESNRKIINQEEKLIIAKNNKRNKVE